MPFSEPLCLKPVVAFPSSRWASSDTAEVAPMPGEDLRQIELCFVLAIDADRLLFCSLQGSGPICQISAACLS